MKGIKRVFIWSISIFAAILLIAASFFYFRFRAATKAMTPSETVAINDSVWCIKDKFVNAYVFKGNNSYLLVDAGISKNNFKKELIKTGIDPEQITTLLLTHTDGDHIGATGLFTNAAIYMHKDEEQMINGTTGKTKYFKTKWKFGAYQLFNNSATINFDGLNVKVIPTPGHTPGSVCFIIGNDYLLTGDNLTVNNGKYEQFIEMFNMNTPKQMESLILLPMPDSFKYLLTGHHGVIKIGD